MQQYLLSLFFSAFMFLLPLLTWAQGSDFEKIFQKETQAKQSGIATFGAFKNINKLSYYPDTIPAWFFNPPQASEESTYAIGISDPDMPKEQAIQQAVYRAKVMAIVFSRAKLQYFRDVYTTEHKDGRYTTYRQRFDTYFKITGGAIADSTHFVLVDQHFTRYNEAIVIVKYTINSFSNEKQMFSAVGTVLYIEAQVNEAFEPQAEYELSTSVRKIGQSPMNSHNLYREKGNRFLYRSGFGGEEQEFPLYYYKYIGANSQGNATPLICYNGLWGQYVKDLLRTLTLTTEQSKVRIKSVGNQQSASNAALYREVAVKNVQMNLIGIEFGRDSIGYNFNLKDFPLK